jgi:hypothetical protein
VIPGSAVGEQLPSGTVGGGASGAARRRRKRTGSSELQSVDQSSATWQGGGGGDATAAQHKLTMETVAVGWQEKILRYDTKLKPWIMDRTKKKSLAS